MIDQPCSDSDNILMSSVSANVPHLPDLELPFQENRKLWGAEMSSLLTCECSNPFLPLGEVFSPFQLDRLSAHCQVCQVCQVLGIPKQSPQEALSTWGRRQWDKKVFSPVTLPLLGHSLTLGRDEIQK